ncbi:MAG: acetyl-CoA hydrolase/transferase C-terminal domain-containing protein [Myxococcota bacterium]|nr:acetyl-CoA hydrolase/transferase C-terminal domain-containing protein [Myxococcota bacterium]
MSAAPDWAAAFGERWGNADQVAARVEDGMDVATGLIEPTTLLAALGQRDVGGSALVAVMALGGLALAQNPRFRLRTGFATIASAPLVAEGRCEYLPLLFSDARRHMRAAEPDCVLVRLAPPDARGRCSYGWAAGFTPELLEGAHERGIPILAEIDPTLPHTIGGRELPVGAIDGACLAQGDAASDTPVAASPHADAIAAHLAPLVPDGATLQVGIGSVPDAAAERLAARDLGIHTEVLGPGLARLVKRGQATGARKAVDRELAVCTIASVDPDVRELVEGSGRAEVRAASEVLDPRRIAEHDRLRCINSAFAVDLRGQVNAESFGWAQTAGVGGQLDFFRGAGLREDALRIIALASETSRGESRIVAGHPPGTVVTATRYDVDVVVTEHGAARLRDQTDEERARALIGVAHPRHRAALEQARFGG